MKKGKIRCSSVFFVNIGENVCLRLYILVVARS